MTLMPGRLKVLWFSPLPANAGNAYGGGGWISSLASEIRSRSDVELGVSYPIRSDAASQGDDSGIREFPLPKPNVGLGRIGRFFAVKRQDGILLESARRVLREFRPDIVQVFGLERVFGLLSADSGIPVIIHLQGLMGPCVNAWVPPGCRMWDYVVAQGWNPMHMALRIRSLSLNRHVADRERRILKSVRYVMGRTEWDRNYCTLFAPQARYFPCQEILRPCFYEPSVWKAQNTPRFVSTLSTPLYKGHDLVLKTAKILFETGHGPFEWQVFGVRDFRFAERKTGIRAADVGVRPMGVAGPERIREALLCCSAYVHPSYIDNSSNGVCEAQILGVPVVSTNVGGLPSLFPPEQARRLVPSNDPYSMAGRILEAVRNPESFIVNRADCLARHNPAAIVDNLLSIYRTVLSETGTCRPTSTMP